MKELFLLYSPISCLPSSALSEHYWYINISVFLAQDKIDAYIHEKTVCEVDFNNGSKVWSCGVCQKYLYKKQDLTRHIESFHVKTSPYYCDLCVAQFNTRRACKRHTLSFHKRSWSHCLNYYIVLQKYLILLYALYLVSSKLFMCYV